LNSIKTHNCEPVNDFYHRVSLGFTSNFIVLVLKIKKKEDAKVIHKTLKEQNSAIFMNGLI